MKGLQTYCSILKKVEPTRFKKLIALITCSFVLFGCSSKVEPVPVMVEEESALSIPYSTGPSNPPEVNIPNTNPPKN